jgi:hypothetical protein
VRKFRAAPQRTVLAHLPPQSGLMTNDQLRAVYRESTSALPET